MTLTRKWQACFLLLVCVFSLALFRSDAHANKPIGNEIDIAHTEIYEWFPKIAYNSTRNEYLVVYWNDRPGCDDIYAQRIASDGTLINGFIAIACGCDADRSYPDVAYDSKHDQYLVVWERKIDRQTWIMGKRITGFGEILDDVEIEIGSCKVDDEPCEKPAVEFAYTSELYYVVWLINISVSDGKFVVGQVVNFEGTVGDPETFNRISLISEQDRSAPALAYNRHANQHLVVWSEKGIDGYWDIRGHQVTGDGDLIGSEIIIADIANKNCNLPSVAAIPTTSTDFKFLIVWEYWYDISDSDIRGVMMSEEGDMGDILEISSSTDYESWPHVAGSESNKQFMVTWGNGNTVGIWSRPVSEYGEMLRDPIRSFSPGGAPSNSDVAAGPVGDFLAVYFDEDFNDEIYTPNVYGQLFGLRIYLPLIVR